MSGILIASEFSGLSLPGMLPSDLVTSWSESSSHNHRARWERHMYRRWSCLKWDLAFHGRFPLLQRQRRPFLLFIASSMALVAERSQDHQYPRHLAWCCATKARFPKMPMGDVDTGFDVDTVRISHLAGFSTSALSSAKVCTTLICCCRVTRELVTVRMSSA